MDQVKSGSGGVVASYQAVSALFLALRPNQWTKNLIVLGPLVFSGRAGEWSAGVHALAAAVGFCLLSSALYLINDVADIAVDRKHPTKRLRPIASGAVSSSLATVCAILLGILSLGAGALYDPSLFLVLASYAALMLAYSYRLKHVAIVDTLVIAIGFTLRAYAGGVVLDVPVSQWMLLCTGSLGMFLAVSKRRAELARLGPCAGTRPSLAGYTMGALDQVVTSFMTLSIVGYSIYATSSGRHPWLAITIPFVVYGVLRYSLLLHRGEGGETPERTLLEDRPLQLALLGWSVTVVAVLYS